MDLFFEKYAEKLVEDGFVGLFGDTSNTAIINLFKRRFGSSVMDSPDAAKQEIKANLVQEIAAGLGDKYRNSPIKRIIVKF